MAAARAVVLETPTYESQQKEFSSEEAVQSLVHDLRQPLSTMEAIAYYLEMTLPANLMEARRYLLRLQRLVEESNSILANAVHDSRKRETEPIV